MKKNLLTAAVMVFTIGAYAQNVTGTADKAVSTTSQTVAKSTDVPTNAKAAKTEKGNKAAKKAPHHHKKHVKGTKPMHQHPAKKSSATPESETK